MTTSAHCHKAIAKIARECAAATYDELMSSSNLVFSAWKAQHPGISDNPVKLRRAFVSAKWGMFVEAARATLALQLRNPIDEKVGEEIVNILALDSTLIRGRVNPAQIAGMVRQKQ